MARKATNTASVSKKGPDASETPGPSRGERGKMLTDHRVNFMEVSSPALVSPVIYATPNEAGRKPD